jgi:23S rRNA (cytosine1962-C5)-methyltransferase
MLAANDYELLDFGEGRKLERLGPYTLDRPAVGTDALERQLPAAPWKQAARYERTQGDRGKWRHQFPLPSTWEINFDQLVFEVKPTEFGHVGVFPEQAANWNWLDRQIPRFEVPIRLLNLFAYTGGSTLAAAKAGAEVVHIDAAENTVAWARQNAAHSGLAESPIRWIVEDSEKFVQRELKRGNRYDAVILDPPSYGHGPKGEVWKIDEHLPHLLSLLAELTEGSPKLLLLSCHSAGYTPSTLRQLVSDAFDREPARRAIAGPMSITAGDGRSLSCGIMLRFASAN